MPKGISGSSPARAVAAAKQPEHKTKNKSIQSKLHLLAQPPFDLLPKQEKQVKRGSSLVSPRHSTSNKAKDQSVSESSFDQVFYNVARLLDGRKNVIVLVGAGISTSCGIPDFRSKDHGLYNKLDVNALGLSCPEDLFCYDFFQENPKPFFQFARNLYFPLGMDKRVQPSDSHKLLALLEQKKMLLRVYSQNIDGLEAVAGVSSKKLVYAHGSLGWATCMRCGKKVTSDEIISAIQQGDVPRCQVVTKKRASSTASTTATSSNSSVGSSNDTNIDNNSPDSVRDGNSIVNTPSSASCDSPAPSREPSRRTAARKRPRATKTLFTVGEDVDAMDDTVKNNGNTDNVHESPLLCGGVLKPAVTFFGETLNDTVRRKIEVDRTKADALIVIGTSLSVAPISKIIEYLPTNIPRILINRTIVHPASPISATAATSSSDDEKDSKKSQENFRENYVFDAYLLGYCDDVTRALARKLFINSNVTSEISENRAYRKKRRNTSSVVESIQNRCCGGLLTNVLQGRDENWKRDDWTDVTNVPSDRVLLFPGALPSMTPSNGDATSDKMVYQEIAHCDGCTKRIDGVINKCIHCFDYDLCSDCFPGMSKTHFNGTHTFDSEYAVLLAHQHEPPPQSMSLISDEALMGIAIQAFANAHHMPEGWATTFLHHVQEAGISSMNDLGMSCRDQTINVDLELFGAPPTELLSAQTIKNLVSFLPGPVGYRCFRVAQRIAQQVERGAAETEYVHRPESGRQGDEVWKVTVNGKWVVNVDCAGFVRNCLKHVTKNPFVMALSDRDFMRAKDFYQFFETIPFSVMDPKGSTSESRLMKWRIVPDLRMVIPGDVIVYRPRGNAAGGAAFTTNDRKDLKHLLHAVKTSQVFWKLRSSGSLVTRNIAKDPKVKVWVAAMLDKLHAIGITTVRGVYKNLDTINEKLQLHGHSKLNEDTLRLLKECCETTAQNTGHIVFAAGRASHKGNNEYRIRVVHSTKHGKLDENGQVTTGVQEYFRRFIVMEDGTWTRGNIKPKENPILRSSINSGIAGSGAVVSDEEDEDDNPNDDMEEDEEMTDITPDDPDPDSGEETKQGGGDELAGQRHVDVIAARMCF
ncbi:NAD-dependent deacetylase [Nitzschia inconspicua]|uniref:NAD-dependent deacetylase n=1 Tax=Nitzschia inconspicua TaxID=303405 RepID=A0A9K3LK55_9STRA|nr:NAD-dependent deacetylase [Nitzschia inconspicua]